MLDCVSFGHVDYREKVQRLCKSRVYSHEDATRDFSYKPRTFWVGLLMKLESIWVNKNETVDI